MQGISEIEQIQSHLMSQAQHYKNIITKSVCLIQDVLEELQSQPLEHILSVLKTMDLSLEDHLSSIQSLCQKNELMKEEIFDLEQQVAGVELQVEMQVKDVLKQYYSSNELKGHQKSVQTTKNSKEFSNLVKDAEQKCKMFEKQLGMYQQNSKKMFEQHRKQLQAEIDQYNIKIERMLQKQEQLKAKENKLKKKQEQLNFYNQALNKITHSANTKQHRVTFEPMARDSSFCSSLEQKRATSKKQASRMLIETKPHSPIHRSQLNSTNYSQFSFLKERNYTDRVKATPFSHNRGGKYKALRTGTDRNFKNSQFPFEIDQKLLQLKQEIKRQLQMCK